jgi:uncharacterized protein (UPF0179 family)
LPLTLVPEPLAAPGYTFTFAGASDGPECAPCPFRKLCFGLEAGRRYEVGELRDVTHPCALHESGRVRVARVEERAFPTSLETRLLRGTAAIWNPIPCGRPDCGKYALCHPVGPQAGKRHEVAAQEGVIPCPAGYELTKVRLKLMKA